MHPWSFSQLGMHDAAHASCRAVRACCVGHTQKAEMLPLECRLHDRMPVLLTSDEQVEAWLDIKPLTDKSVCFALSIACADTLLVLCCLLLSLFFTKVLHDKGA